MVLLDTNACISLLNNNSLPLVSRMRRRSPDEIALCSIVKAELIYGAYHSSRIAQNLRTLQRFFEAFYSFPFDDDCAAAAGRLRADLAQAGSPIGPNDLLIAATALTNDRILVTASTREFDRVPGLVIENWAEAAG